MPDRRPSGWDSGKDADETSIGDFVWSDDDGDGLQDAGEPGLAGVTVYADLDDNGAPDGGEPTDTTDAAGAYALVGLAAGSYAVRVDGASVPAGFVLTTGNVPLAVTLAAGEAFAAADFGYQRRDASIGDFVWSDDDGDGVQDAGEPGLAGVTVYADLDDNGALDGGEPSDTTDAAGAYALVGLPAGSYTVRVEGSSVASGFVLTTGNDPLSVVLSAGEAFAGADFGYQQRLPVLGVAKEVIGRAVQDVGGTFTVSLQMTLENLGSSPLLDLRLTDDLQAVFPFPAAVVGVSSPVVISPASPTVATNPFYDGTTDIDLLLRTQSSLGIGETAVIGFDVTFSAPDPTVTFFNSAIGAATSPSGQSTADLSVDGADPDPDGDGDPGGPGEGAPTPILLPVVMAIPTLGHLGMFALALILFFVGLWTLRRVP